jgi:hypothetical protein
VSLPFGVSDPTFSAQFPQATSQGAAYIPGVGNVVTDTLLPGRGYWLRFDSTEIVGLSGIPVTAESVHVAAGWNLLGSVLDTLPASAIATEPPGIVVSRYYSFTSDSGYAPTALIEPARGHWVKCSDSGVVLLSSSLAFPLPAQQPSPDAILGGLSVLAVGDASGRHQMLYYGLSGGEGGVSPELELPPRPPLGIFDARFGSGRMLELVSGQSAEEFPVIVQSSGEPLTISWNHRSAGLTAMLRAGSLRVPLGGEGNVTIPAGAPVSLVLGGEPSIPETYVLLQNYPNPFNPSTTIRYGLPAAGPVTLKVYNLLGQEVKTLVDEVQEAGFRTVEWDSRNNGNGLVGSGVYFYELRAGSFVQERKMLLLK